MFRPSLFRILLLGLMAASLKAGPVSLQLTLPPGGMACLVFRSRLYYDNVVLTEQPENFRFEVSCDIGTAESRRRPERQEN